MDNSSLLASWRIEAETDRVWVSRRTVELAAWAGASRQCSWEIAIAAAELASNAVRYGGGGTVELWLTELPRLALSLVVRDGGIGFGGAVDASDSAGENTPDESPSYRWEKHGLGIGLETVRRMMSDVRIESGARGTVVTASKLLLPGPGL